jgi:hypothetical protein
VLNGRLMKRFKKSAQFLCPELLEHVFETNNKEETQHHSFEDYLLDFSAGDETTRWRD